jgi:hypothetical protein
MIALKPTMSREYSAVQDWLNMATTYRSRIAAETAKAPSVVLGFDRLTYAIANLGECELHARSLERSLAIEVFEDRRPSLKARVDELNEIGIQEVEALRKSLRAIEKECGTLKISKESIAKAVPMIRRHFREKIAEWEMKGTDAKKLMDVASNLLDALAESGTSGVVKYADAKLEELAAVRRESDRGARENIPWWKILIIVGMFAIIIVSSVIALFERGDVAAVAALVGWGLATAAFVCLMIFC